MNLVLSLEAVYKKLNLERQPQNVEVGRWPKVTLTQFWGFSLKSVFKKLKFRNTTLTCSGWKMTSILFKAVLTINVKKQRFLWEVV